MSDCCATTECVTKLVCPDCAKTCHAVAFQTVLHQLKFPDVLEAVESEYYFCSNELCNVAYFSAAGHLIAKQQLRAFSVTKLCYCFDINRQTYKTALVNHTAEKIKQFVVQQTKAGRCACEIRNPSGRCCLSHFKQLENEA